MSEQFSQTPEFVGTRHSIKPDTRVGEKSAEGYFGLSERGVELARKRAGDILKSLEDSDNGTIMAFIGATEAERTKATVRVYGDEILKLTREKGNPNIEVISESDWQKELGFTENIQKIANKITNNPNTKYLLAFPLQMKEFRLQDRWQNPDGSWASEYAKGIFEESGFDNQKVIESWLVNQGKINNLTGPNPKEVAEEELAGVERARRFVEKLIPERPVKMGFVGHGPNIDALAIYLANNGIVDLKGFQKVGKEPFDETDMVEVKQDQVSLPTGEYKI